jgi:hypothetical protein
MNTSNASAGKLHLLDLADMKSQMGERWARMADPVERFFEGAVRRNLGPGDTFLRQGELSYLLLFRDLSPEEAQIKCRTISEEVCERLFGDQIQRASLRTLVMPLGPDVAVGNAISGALDELLERKGRETILQISKGGAAAPDAPAPVSHAPDEGCEIDTTSYLYRPIWDATKKVVLTYLCQGTAAGDQAQQIAARESGRAEDRQAVIDRCVLRECASRTEQLHRDGLRLLSGVSVDLGTISHSRLWAPYSKQLQTIPSHISRDFAFFVTGIDSGVPNIRLSQELPKLTRLSHQIFCVLEDRGYIGTRFARTGTHAIGIALQPGEAESLAMVRIAELTQQAADGSLAAFVLGIPSSSLMLYALAQGIRYLEGPAIRPALADPRHAFVQSLEHVYTSRKINAAAG